MKYLMISLLALAGCAHGDLSRNNEVDSREPTSLVKPNNLTCAYGYYLSRYEDCRPITMLTVPKAKDDTIKCPENYSVEGSTFGADNKAYWICNLER